MNNKNQNVLEILLKQLNVKFTSAYASKIYGENPYKNSLFGISRMLADYNVETRGVKLNDKDEITSLEVPFLTVINDNVALINKITKEHVSCSWGEQKIKAPLEEFKRRWNGVALLVEKTKTTEEPRYKENYKRHLYSIFQKYVLSACVVLLALIGLESNHIHTDPGLLLLLLVNLAGGYMGYLLIQKQLFIQNNHAERICSLFKKGNCDDVLFSPAAKFMGIIGWSEIGFSYFISNLFIILFSPSLIPYLALINVCALPYSIWSIWYQKFKIKQWCPFCLIVQALLWIVFLINLIFHYISLPSFEIVSFFCTGIIYALPFILIGISISAYSKGKQSDYIHRHMNELKIKPEVFEALIKKQPHYNVDLSTSKIIWGNKDANILISILTNPHCIPCAEMHEYVEKILNTAKKKVCIQYVFTSFDNDFESCKFLIAAYLSKNDPDKKKEIYNKWFRKGKYNKEEFFKIHGFNKNTKAVEREMDRHKKWRDSAQLNGTPTILVNGYELPYNYRIEDILYFTDMKI